MDDQITRFRLVLTTRGALLLVVLGAAFIFFWTIRPILPPLLWALIIAYLLDPVVRKLSRWLRVRRFVVVVALVLALVGALVWGMVTLRPILWQEMQDLLAAMPRIFADVQDFLLGSEPIVIMGNVVDPAPLKEELNKAVQTSVSTLGRQAIPVLVRAVSSLFHFVFFLVATFYLLLDLDKIGPALVNFLPRRWRLDVIPLLIQMERVLGNYIRGQVLLILLQIVASGIVLTVFQVRYALLLALVTGFVEIFPVIGPWTAGGIAVSVALTQKTALFGGNSVMLAMAVAASYAVLRQLEDMFVIPNLLGKIMEMHPLVVLFSLTAGAYLAGLLGILVAVPIAAVVKLFLRFVHEKFMEEERIYAASSQAAAEHVVSQEAG